jgi:hypothetical protein
MGCTATRIAAAIKIKVSRSAAVAHAGSGDVERESRLVTSRGTAAGRYHTAMPVHVEPSLTEIALTMISRAI